MNQTELCELMTVPGFYRFVAQQAQLSADDVQKIYLLGRPWGVWPPGIDLSQEAADAGIDIFTYLAALQPLITMDTQAKEADLAAYEMTLRHGETSGFTSPTSKHVEKVAALVAHKKQTICNMVRALYVYRERVGALSILKMIENRTTAIAKLQSGLAAEITRREGDGHGPAAHSTI
jgi:hypothetical protein